MLTKEPKAYVQCSTSFIPRSVIQKYCGRNCREKSAQNGKTVIVERQCKGCDNKFTKNASYKYCSPECRKKYYESLKPKKNSIIKFNDPKIPKIKHFPKSDLLNLDFNNEKEFVEWFKLNLFLFGIKKIIKLDPFFPDCRAELFNGQLIDIELEHHANNFKTHKHPHDCDLIISFLKSPNQTHIGSIPIIALFDNYQKRSLTPYFQTITNFCNYLATSVLSDSTNIIHPSKTKGPSTSISPL